MLNPISILTVLFGASMKSADTSASKTFALYTSGVPKKNILGLSSTCNIPKRKRKAPSRGDRAILQLNLPEFLHKTRPQYGKLNKSKQDKPHGNAPGI